ncbi:maestro heat-like repeat-containing protein family member 7 [Aquila chrysaetos chrysaetos]|uniref:maestro heat-like repeat-containing protein family member 7 n=1 Tax=Aquila chrysaetos chrysaetos TaxID=223781 RepID=UPI001B7D4122|nr:maestro heat-like repeat-containing protein family member 7 [Aquila chrysaetos chrysaetos]
MTEGSGDASRVRCDRVDDLLGLVGELKEEAERLRSIREREREIDWYGALEPEEQASEDQGKLASHGLGKRTLLLGETPGASAPWPGSRCVQGGGRRAGEGAPLFPLPPAPAYSSPRSCSSSGAAAAASHCQLEGEEKEALDCFLAFLHSTGREEASKRRFLAAIRTLCGAWLRGRYRPSSSSARELLEKIELLRRKEAPRSTDAVMWQQAVLAVAAVSEEKEGLLAQHLCPCLHSIFHLPPAQQTDSERASLDAEILRTLDSVLEVLMHGARLSSSDVTVERILQVLLPFMASQEVARRRRAVGRVVRLSQIWMSSLMLEAVPFRKGNFFLFREKPVEFLGQLMGHVALSCAEEDREISCAAAEALGALHSFVLLRQGCQAAREDRELPTQRESASTIWPKEPADETTVFGSFLLPKERSDFLLTVLSNMVHPRVSDAQTVANVLEVVLRHSCSELVEVEEITQTIHVQLAHLSRKPLQDILRTTLVQVAHLNPRKVTAGLLRASPHCDSTARAMWRILASEPCLADSVLRRLLLQQEDASQRGDTGECSRCRFLAVAGAMHEIFVVPSSRDCVRVLVDELFVAVVLQLSFSLKSPGRGCCTAGSRSREASHPPVRPIRSTVSTMQALFHCLGGASLAEDIGRQGAWDALMSPETYPTGIAALTR